MKQNSQTNTLVARIGPLPPYNLPNASVRDAFPRTVRPNSGNLDATLCDANPSKRIGSNGTISRSPQTLLEQVLEGLDYHAPELCEEGLNGTYFLRNKGGRRIAVFKPIDEEGDNADNPKRSFNDGQFVNRGILPGEGARREVAAYLLDYGHYHAVPETIMASLSHPHFRSSSSGDDVVVVKIGSLQEYIDSDGSAEDVGPKQFRVRDVHKIGVLDLRIFNTDRHAGNILITEESDGSYRLTPIDQGLSLPPKLEHAWFDWLHWPQAKLPFDAETRSFIRHINVNEDADLLEKLGIHPDCIRTMKISSTLLKKGAAAGLTLYEIGSMASRTVLDQPSALERMFEQVAKETKDEATLLQDLDRLMDAEIAVKVGEQCPSPRLQECERCPVHQKIAV